MDFFLKDQKCDIVKQMVHGMGPIHPVKVDNAKQTVTDLTEVQARKLRNSIAPIFLNKYYERCQKNACIRYLSWSTFLYRSLHTVFFY